jgi:hypothetical protein
VVRPLAAQVCKVDLALARHRRCTAISRQASTCTPSSSRQEGGPSTSAIILKARQLVSSGHYIR